MAHWSSIRSVLAASEVYNSKEVQNDETDGDYDQKMYPTAGAREAWTYVPTEKAKQPKDYKNHDDRPQHEISPFRMLNNPRYSTVT